ncbi:uncharacterized protein LOC133519076 [Cydia pomonella]|uniref:uncharacterized protein LOC133519076 n=1 Tax=Cydia pomonella TaxID=82600 RepID=UPI002ADDA851|nr:uncharacterized protein LOC133519076 [Cydia pomonella]
MKAGVFALLLLVCYVECKKTYAPLDKHANVDFINMEGGGIKPAPRPGGVATPPSKPPVVQPAQTPQQASVPKPAQIPQPAPTTGKPAPAVTIKPAQPAVTPAQPKTPNQIKPVPVNPSPVANPITTPGPGSVKDLVNFYNSQGKGSQIRPYSYSQAVKQG